MINAKKDTYVKKQIRGALLDLLEEKELKAITIGCVTDRAQVSRVSFYRNYKAKEDVVREHMGLLFEEWTSRFDAAGGGPDDVLMGRLFAHLSEHRHFYLLLRRRSLLHLLREFLKEICGPKPEYPNFGAYVAAFFSYGLYGWIEEWFARGMTESAEEMTVLLQNRDLGAS